MITTVMNNYNNASTAEAYDEDNTSSSVNHYIYFINDDELNKTSSKKDDSIVNALEDNSLRKINNLIEKRYLLETKLKTDTKLDELAREFESCLEYDTDDSMAVSSKKFAKLVERQYSLRTLGDVMQRVYVRDFDKAHFMNGICKCLMRYDLAEVNPWGAIMLAGLLNHKDEMVKESALELVDNWEDKELVPLLSTLDVKSEWMKKYIEDLINRLGNKDVLCAKNG